MKTRTVKATSVARADRLDSWYFLSPGSITAELVRQVLQSGVKSAQLGGSEGLGRVWSPNRFKRAYAAPGESSISYLRPYDVFEYIPLAADLLSIRRTKKLESYKLRKGMILQTCSGRNLGPAVYVDDYLARFALSHDMVRVEIKDEVTRFYVLAFLQSRVGQALLRRDKSGSVIDHINDEHVSAIPIPLFSSADRAKVAELSRRAVTARERARVDLDTLRLEYERQLPAIDRTRRLCKGWTVRARSIVSRVDSASFDPLVAEVRKELIRRGGVPVGVVADVAKPAGRYKTRYVPEGYGLPLLSGAQVLQARPINLQYLHTSALSDASRYKLKSGWIVYQADGRAEEALGQPAVLTKDRDGWLASGHVGRVIPNDPDDSGWLYLALSTAHAQLQIKSLASGSVVDSTFPDDMLSVVVPPRGLVDDARATLAWNKMAEAQESEDMATKMVEQLIEAAVK